MDQPLRNFESTFMSTIYQLRYPILDLEKLATSTKMAPLQFGVLMFPFQLVDCAMPLDVLSSSSKPYIAGMHELGGYPSHVADKAIDIEFHYIGASSLDPIVHTAGFRSVPSVTCGDCPKLDYLLIGGPDPKYIATMPKEFIKFMQERVKEVKTIFTTCTGGMIAAASGILDGIEATTNHDAVAVAQKMMPNVKWTKAKQWVVSEGGKFWTAGGACAGMDMFAHWVIENYGMEVAMCGFRALDYHPRGLDKQLIKLPSMA
jgi:transcriptional regulator GlxA family with amidase domain